MGVPYRSALWECPTGVSLWECPTGVSYECPTGVPYGSVPMALTLCGSGGPPHVKLVVEWEPRLKDW
uniref:Uncharacterized protein n=1 Tax=Knipowitschia caucasica TaxID=637954 RepID=A0AAV2KKW1_KNICA